MNERVSGADAGEIIGRLRGVYVNYIDECGKQPQRKGLSGLFKGWFKGHDTSADAMDQAFLDGVWDLLSELKDALDGMDVNGQCEYAAKAMDLIAQFRPQREKTSCDWHLSTAEYHCEVILPYLAADNLRRIRDDYVKRTPKRMMFPKQREIYAKMNELLEIKEGR